MAFKCNWCVEACPGVFCIELHNTWIIWVDTNDHLSLIVASIAEWDVDILEPWVLLIVHLLVPDNAFCLADDLMEPYRPIVDRLVRHIIINFDDLEDLSLELKRKLLAIPTIDVTIDGHNRPLMVAVDQTTASLYKCYAGESKRIIYPEL